MMKQYLLPIVTFICLLCLNPYLALVQEKPQEEVTVTAVEVPVRVIQKGQVLRALAQDDFEIYEDGIKQKITGFEIISRKISVRLEEREAKPEKRVFILIFNIFDYFDEVGKAIDYFYDNHFRQGDQVLILTEDQLFDTGGDKDTSKTARKVKERLKKIKQISSHAIHQAYRDLKHHADKLINIFQRIDTGGRENPNQELVKFYNYYTIIWKDYCTRYLLPDLDHYRSIIKRIKLMEGEKWILCFQQRRLFPVLKNEGRLEREITRHLAGMQVSRREQHWARIIETKQRDLRRKLNFSRGFDSEKFLNLFLEANLTFHLILLKSSRPLVSQDFKLDEVHQEYEASLKDLSFTTGGISIFSNKVTEALIEASQKEDYYYSLWYTTTRNRILKDRDIEVKVKRKGTEVVYRKHFTPVGKPPIVITDFKAQHKAMEFTLINYERRKIGGKEGGVVEVKITLFDENSEKVFSELKTMSLPKVDAHFSIGFPKLKSGNYYIIIEATDKILNEKNVFSRYIKI